MIRNMFTATGVVLINHGADLMIKNNGGKTALDVCSLSGGGGDGVIDDDDWEDDDEEVVTNRDACRAALQAAFEAYKRR